MQESKSPGRRVWPALLVTGVLLSVVVVFAWRYWPAVSQLLEILTLEKAKAWIISLGAWGMLGSIGLMVLHSFLPFPSEFITLANGMVYGPVLGAAITWTGAMLGAVVAFGLVRWLGRPVIFRFLSLRHQAQLDSWSRERGGMSLLACRLIPVIAFNLINYGAALTTVSWWTFLWTTALGILPLTVLLSIAGSGMLEVPNWAWVTLALIGVVWFGITNWKQRTR